MLFIQRSTNISLIYVIKLFLFLKYFCFSYISDIYFSLILVLSLDLYDKKIWFLSNKIVDHVPPFKKGTFFVNSNF